MSNSLCKTFLNLPPGRYKPLVCKEIIFTSRTIGQTGKRNAAEYFFLLKPNTLREHATLDLLYPTPNFLKFAIQNDSKSTFVRQTSGGFTRITTASFIRVTT